jgi:exodeoxyribonuclease V beta subunit
MSFILEEFPLSPGFTVIEAGAGAGKTYNLIGLVNRFATQPGDKPLVRNRDIRRVLMVTFTNAAAQEMRQRLRTKFIQDNNGPAQRHLGGMFISTIHAFCHMAYRDYGPKAGLPPVEGEMQSGAGLVSELAQDWWRTEVATGGAPPAVGKCVHCVKNVLATPDIQVPTNLAGLKAYALRRSSEIAAATGLLTFDSAIKNLYAALKDPSTAQKLRDSIHADYDVCLVDEAQDTDHEQYEILVSLFGPGTGKTLIMVGDRKQAIYGFRGADVENYLKAVQLARSTPNGKVLTINENNRCSVILKDVLNKVFSNEKREPFFGPTVSFQPIEIPTDERRKKAEALNLSPPIRIIAEDGEDVVVRETANLLCELNQEAEAQADDEMARSKVNHEATIGILVSKQKEAEQIHRALTERGLPAAIAGNASIFSTQTARHIHLLLNCVLNPERTGLRRALFAMRPSLFGLEGELESLVDRHDEDLTAWLRDIREDWSKNGFGPAWLKLTRKEPSVGIPSIRIACARRQTGARLLANFDHIGELLMLRERTLKLGPEPLLNHLAKRIKAQGTVETEDAEEDERIRPETARPQIIVRTMHSAKGLEYHGVILPGIGDGKKVDPKSGGVLRQEGNAELIDENTDDATQGRLVNQSHLERARLLYVALTRAQRKLVLLWEHKDGAQTNAKYSFAHCFERVHGTGTPAALAELLGVKVEEKASEGLIQRAKRLTLRPEPIRVEEPARTPSFIRASTSFSRLSKLEDDEAKSHSVPGNDASELPLTDFPSGKAPGLFLHAVLETLDFARAAEDKDYCLTQTLSQLTRSGLFQGRNADKREPMARKIAEALPLWLRHPLRGSGLVLAQTSPQGRSAEMRFSLRCQPHNKARSQKHAEHWKDQILEAFREEYVGGAEAKLAAVDVSNEAVEGLLNGSIDLAATHQSDGRIYIIDWKSNKLGFKAEHYQGVKLVDGIFGHNYQLQYTLYAAALHMHMKACLPDWDYERLGGCHYLFLRALGHGDHAGDFFHRPSWKQVSSVLMALGFDEKEIR